MSLLFPSIFLLLLTGLAVLAKIPYWALFVYLAASIITFLCYLFDKSAARKGQWRTPESTLHLMGLIGGWPGALIAQKLLHHKNRKVSFQLAFWTTVLLNCGCLIWLLSPPGSRTLHAFF